MTAEGMALKTTVHLLRARAAKTATMLAEQLRKPDSKTSDLLALVEMIGDQVRAVRGAESEVAATLIS